MKLVLASMLAMAVALSGCSGGDGSTSPDLDGTTTPAPTSGSTISGTSPPPSTSPAPTGPVPGEPAFTQQDSVEGALVVGYFWDPSRDITNEGVDHADHVLTVSGTAPDGAPAGATHLNFTLAGPNPGVGHNQANFNLYFLNPEGEILASSADEDFTDPAHFGPEYIDLNATMPLPPGDYVLRVVLYFGAQANYTLSWSIDYSYV